VSATAGPPAFVGARGRAPAGGRAQRRERDEPQNRVGLMEATLSLPLFGREAKRSSSAVRSPPGDAPAARLDFEDSFPIFERTRARRAAECARPPPPPCGTCCSVSLSSGRWTRAFGGRGARAFVRKSEMSLRNRGAPPARRRRGDRTAELDRFASRPKRGSDKVASMRPTAVLGSSRSRRWADRLRGLGREPRRRGRSRRGAHVRRLLRGDSRRRAPRAISSTVTSTPA